MLRLIHAISMVAGAMLLYTGAAQAVVINVFSNGGFETNDGTTATGWVPAGSGGYAISGDARTGSASMELDSGISGSDVGFQNSLVDGGIPELDADGTTPTLSFWAKGFQGTSGNLLYALRYLDAVGNILADSTLINFGSSVNTTTWSNITLNTLVVPTGAKAAFLELVQQTGGVDDSFVLIDDVELNANVNVNEIPVPAAVWLFGSGLVGLVGIARRKKKVA